MIRHHPSGDLLTAYASGALGASATLAVGSHVDVCAACRSEVSLLDGLGGLFLTRSTPASLSHGALERALERIDRDTTRPRAPAPLPGFLARFDIPKRLRSYDIGGRQWLAPGIWFAPVRVARENETCTYLIYGAKNKTLPRHTHAGREFTTVLSGAYSEELGHFAAGDFAEADADVLHAQTVTADAECLCLISSDGPMKFEALSARVIQSLAGHRY
jgi:putative transcriptional regulator